MVNTSSKYEIIKPYPNAGIRLFLYAIFICFLHFTNSFSLYGQSRTIRYENWGGYIGTIKLNEKWSIWNDLHYVPSVFGVWRTGVTHSFPSKLSVTGGYAQVITATSFSQQLIRNELRPWGQVLYRFGISDKLTAQIRFRYDARFRQTLTSDNALTQGFSFNHRWRFMGGLRYCLKRWGDDKKLHLNMMNEWLFQSFPQSGGGLKVDQNRLFLLIGFTYKRFTLQTGYHNRMQPNLSGGKWHYNQGPTVWVIHDIQSNKSKKQIPKYQDVEDNLF
jgi:hypothetical protein